MKSNMIYPCLWFNGKAKEAADFYFSVFDNSVITFQNQMVVIFESSGQKFSPVLMFTDKQAGRAEQAIHFYTSVFEGSDIIGIVNYTKDDNDIEGTVKHAEFTLGTHAFMAMDSSLMHQFSFSEAISLVVDCETQEEIDYYWDKLTDGGEEIQCGWLKDRFGVSWQIVPVILYKLMSDPSRSERVTKAFLQMKKFEIEKLIKA